MHRAKQVWYRFWSVSWWIKGPVLAFAALLVLANITATCGAGAEPPTVTITATATVTQTPRPTATPRSTATPRPVATETTVPTATAPPTETPWSSWCGAPPNPWGYHFCAGGARIDSPSPEFCSYFSCIGNFWNGRGHVIQCRDEMYSKSGGIQGSCSHHGGNLRPLYAFDALLQPPEPTQPPPQQPPQTSNCDPSYPDVCFPIGAADYDCAGGSGNGPNYIQGPIRVLPPDPHGLDRDGDGIGCES